MGGTFPSHIWGAADMQVFVRAGMGRAGAHSSCVNGRRAVCVPAAPSPPGSAGARAGTAVAHTDGRGCKRSPSLARAPLREQAAPGPQSACPARTGVLQTLPKMLMERPNPSATSSCHNTRAGLPTYPSICMPASFVQVSHCKLTTCSCQAPRFKGLSFIFFSQHLVFHHLLITHHPRMVLA